MSLLILSLVYLISLLLFLSALYLLTDRFFKGWLLQQNREMAKETTRIMLPLKIQAYERMILFLERIYPQNLILRELRSGMQVTEFHLSLVNSVRQEFEHNLAQQLYVSGDAWELVRSAKEEVIQLIHKASMDAININDSSVLAGVIIESSASGKMLSWHQAARKLKEEFDRLG